jgi:hypothetical protein
MRIGNERVVHAGYCTMTMGMAMLSSAPHCSELELHMRLAMPAAGGCCRLLQAAAGCWRLLEAAAGGTGRGNGASQARPGQAAAWVLLSAPPRPPRPATPRHAPPRPAPARETRDHVQGRAWLTSCRGNRTPHYYIPGCVPIERLDEQQLASC